VAHYGQNLRTVPAQ